MKYRGDCLDLQLGARLFLISAGQDKSDHQRGKKVKTEGESRGHTTE